MNRRPLRHGFALACLALLLAGCAASPPRRLYILGDPAVPEATLRSETGVPVIALRAVALPDYLDSTDILRRTGPNEVTPSPSGEWGERLSVGFTRALAAALAKRMPDMVIATTSVAKPLHRLSVEVDSIDIGTAGLCLVSADWRITGEDRRTLSTSEHGTFSEPLLSADDAAIASAMTRAIDRLAEQIARNLGRFRTSAE